MSRVLFGGAFVAVAFGLGHRHREPFGEVIGSQLAEAADQRLIRRVELIGGQRRVELAVVQTAIARISALRSSGVGMRRIRRN